MYAQSPVTAQPAATLNAGLVSRVKDQIKMLKDHGAKNGARRLEEVVQHFQYYTVEGAAQYIRKDEIIDELESQPHKVLSLMRAGRNVLGIGPIIITWIALFVAATSYASDLVATPGDVYQPFLLLWQEGFHGRSLPFSDAALGDFLFLFLLILLIIAVPIVEWGHLKRLHTLLEPFTEVINDLLAELGKSGADAHLADSDIAKLSTIIETSIQNTLNSLMIKYSLMAEDAREFVKSTHAKTDQLVKNFDADLAVFNVDVKLLTSDLQKVDQNIHGYGQRLQELGEANNKLVGSSQDLALNAKNLADSATLSAQASQGISDRLTDLNVAQQEIIKTQKDVVQELTTTQQLVGQTIVDSQKEVVEQLTGAADLVERSGKNTRDVANNLGQVAMNLEQLTRADFQSMTDGVKKANQDLVDEVHKTSSEVQQVVQGLSQVGAYLQQTTRALDDASQKLAATPGTAPVASRTLFGKAALSVIIGVSLAVISELGLLIVRMH
jgi:uncharacterized phage infection (PIP) family protein YhgE